MTFRIQRALQDAKHRMQLLAQQMEAASPLKKLTEGYALVTDEQGKTVHDFEQIEMGSRLTLRMMDGDVVTRVEEKRCRKEQMPES